MKQSRLFLYGVCGFFAASWIGLIAIPQFQFGNIGPDENKDTNALYPYNIGGYAAQGRAVYVANGCVSCHTQLVRNPANGTDILRDWGTRQTVARDYIYDSPVLLGQQRMGPDLANLGAPGRDELKYRADPKWQYAHLYAPRSLRPHSNMPAFRNLFEVRKVVGQRSDEALDLDESAAPKPGYEIVPTLEAKQLVAYLLSLDRTRSLPESPLKEAPKK